MKMFQPNPTRLPDGTWETHLGDVEVTFYMHEKEKQGFKDAFAQELRNLGISSEVEFVGE